MSPKTGGDLGVLGLRRPLATIPPAQTSVLGSCITIIVSKKDAAQSRKSLFAEHSSTLFETRRVDMHDPRVPRREHGRCRWIAGDYHIRGKDREGDRASGERRAGSIVQRDSRA